MLVRLVFSFLACSAPHPIAIAQTTSTSQSGTETEFEFDLEAAEEHWEAVKPAIEARQTQEWRDAATYGDWLTDVPLGISEGIENVPRFFIPLVADGPWSFQPLDGRRTKLGRGVSLGTQICVLLLPVIVPVVRFVRRRRGTAVVARQLALRTRDRRRRLDDVEQDRLLRAIPNAAERRVWCGTEQYRRSRQRHLQEMESLLEQHDRTPLDRAEFMRRMEEIGQRHLTLTPADLEKQRVDIPNTARTATSHSADAHQPEEPLPLPPETRPRHSIGTKVAISLAAVFAGPAIILLTSPLYDWSVPGAIGTAVVGSGLLLHSIWRKGSASAP